MSGEERAFYAEERRRAMEMLRQVPDRRLIYVLGFLEGALIPEEADPYEKQRDWAVLNGWFPQAPASADGV